MQYATVPAIVRQSRVVPVFTFSELPEDVQETLIDRAEDRPDYEWLGELSRDDLETDASEYWIPEHIAPLGFDVSTRLVKLMGGSYRHDPHIGWSDRYGMDVWFRANVDVETFILRHKLGNQYRALLNRARTHDVWASVGAEDGERHQASATVECTYDYDMPEEQRERLDAQARSLEEDILDAYNTVTRQMERSFRDQIDYYGSRDYYRNQLEDDDALYTIDGRVFRGSPMA